jgi:hypothetical protein
MNGGFKTQPASAASSPSVSDAYAREELIPGATLVNDRADDPNRSFATDVMPSTCLINYRFGSGSLELPFMVL